MSDAAQVLHSTDRRAGCAALPRISARHVLLSYMTSYGHPLQAIGKRAFSSTTHTSALATKLLQLNTDHSMHKTTAATREYTE